MKKFRGITIRRIDKTVEPDKKTGKYKVVAFRVRISNDIVPDDRICQE